jgi:phospholipid-binding lipoprotein MlaA
MGFVKSRRYVGYLASLLLIVTATFGYASADDKQVVKPQPEVAAKIAPAAGTPAKKAEAAAPAKKAVAKKKAVKTAQQQAYDDAAFDDATGYIANDNDPWEPLNRAIFGFNRTVDTCLLRPVTSVYRFVVPASGREAVSNVLVNLYAPVTFANSILQVDPQNTFATFWRFVINTTFGIGGIFDVASEAGLKNRTTDLGQTFGIWGADEGPYFVIPVMGPSNVRDTFGVIGDIFFFPPNYSQEWAVPLAIGATAAIDARSRNMDLIDDVYRTSLDPYATFRSGYMQKRAADIKRAKAARAQSQLKAIH